MPLSDIELKERLSEHLRMGAPRPRVAKWRLYYGVLEIMAGMEPHVIVRTLHSAGWTDAEVKDFKQWFLRTGLKEGWLSQELFQE